MKLSCKYTTSGFPCQAIFKNILLIFNKIKQHFLRRKWHVLTDKTPFGQKNAGFQNGKMKGSERDFRRNWAWN